MRIRSFQLNVFTQFVENIVIYCCRQATSASVDAVKGDKSRIKDGIETQPWQKVKDIGNIVFQIFFQRFITLIEILFLGLSRCWK